MQPLHPASKPTRLISLCFMSINVVASLFLRQQLETLWPQILISLDGLDQGICRTSSPPSYTWSYSGNHENSFNCNAT